MEENNNGQMVEQTTTPQPEEKKKDGSVLGTFFGFIFIGMLVVGFLFMGKFNDFINEKFPKIGQMAGIDKDDTKPLEEEKPKEVSYVGKYTKSVTEENGTVDTASLILRDDKTFAYDESNKDCYNPLVGTYEIDNDVINFTGKVAYSCDSCYYKEGELISNFSANIINEKIVLKGEFTKNSEVEETKDTKKYVTNPINGTTPDENENPWLECN